MNLQTDIFGRYYTLTDKLTDGLHPSVFDSTCQNDRRMYIRISFKRETFFFGVQFPSVIPSANVFFIFPTDIATDSGITDERKIDGRIPSMRMLVNKLLTKS